MKKLFAILAISVAVASCGNGGENKATTDSTAAPIVDTAAVTPAPVDTTAAPMVDTMHHDTTTAH